MKTLHSDKAPRSANAGFSIVEVVVAVLILSVGILGLAGTAAFVTRQVNEGGQQAYAASRVQAITDSLRSLRCTLLTNGSTTASASNFNVNQAWTVSTMNGGSSRSVRVAVKWVTRRGNSREQSFTASIPCR